MKTAELQNIELHALRKALAHIDDYCGKNDIAIPTSRNKGFDTLKLIDEIRQK